MIDEKTSNTNPHPNHPLSQTTAFTASDLLQATCTKKRGEQAAIEAYDQAIALDPQDIITTIFPVKFHHF